MKIDFINKDLINQKDLDNILKLYQKKFPQSNWQLSDIKKIIKSDSLFVVIRNDNGRIVALARYYDNCDLHDYKKYSIKHYIPDMKCIIISDLISTIKGGGSFLIKFLLLKYRKNIFLTSIDIPTMKFYEKVGFVKCPVYDDRDHRLVMVYYINKKMRKLYREKTILVVKVEGVKINYNELEQLINSIYKNTPVEVIDSKELAKRIHTLTTGDIIIGFYNIAKWKGINNKILFEIIDPDYNRTLLKDKLKKYKERTDAIG